MISSNLLVNGHNETIALGGHGGQADKIKRLDDVVAVGVDGAYNGLCNLIGALLSDDMVRHAGDDGLFDVCKLS